MRIFGKHIFRSIKARPLQPVMIILIIAVSAAVAISSFVLPITIYRDAVAKYSVDEWTDDLYVTLKSTADVRLVFEEEIAEAVGDRGRTIGEFALNGTYKIDGETKSLSVSALDLVKADGFYEPRYTEYGKFTTTNIRTSAIVSERFAKRNGLSVGDSLTFTVLGREFTYTVQAIAMNTGIFNERECLVDISGLREVLAERSPFIASLSSDFTPYTRVNVKLYDKASVEAVREDLESHPAFFDKRISQRTVAGDGDLMPLMRTVTVVMPGALLLAISVMLTVSSLELLQKKRREDIALFRMVGADRRHLNALSYLECLVYGVVGGVIGAVLALPITVGLNRLYSFKYTEIEYGFPEAILGVAFAIFFALLSAAINIQRQKKKSLSTELSGVNCDTDRLPSLKKLLVLLPVAVFGAVTFAFPVRQSYIPAIGFVFSLVVLLYVLAPYAISGFASLLLRPLRKVRRGFGDLILSARSCENSYPLKHAGRIMTVILSVFCAMSFVVFSINDQLSNYMSFANFDNVALSADDDTEQMLRNAHGVIGAADATIQRNVLLDGEVLAMGISVRGDVDSCFNEGLFPKKFPTGDEIALSAGVAKMIDAEVGDRLECTVGDVECTLTVTEIVRVRSDFVFYDAENVGVNYEMLCILTDGTESAENEVRALLDERGIERISGDDVFASTYEVLIPQVTLVSSMFYVMLLMSILGIANILAEQRMARAPELRVLMQNGKTKGGLRALMAKEIALVFVCALVMALICAALLCIFIDRGASSFGMTLFK